MHVESIRLNYFYKANCLFIAYRMSETRYSFPVTSKRKISI